MCDCMSGTAFLVGGGRARSSLVLRSVDHQSDRRALNRALETQLSHAPSQRLLMALYLGAARGRSKSQNCIKWPIHAHRPASHCLQTIQSLYSIHRYTSLYIAIHRIHRIQYTSSIHFYTSYTVYIAIHSPSGQNTRRQVTSLSVSLLSLAHETLLGPDPQQLRTNAQLRSPRVCRNNWQVRIGRNTSCDIQSNPVPLRSHPRSSSNILYDTPISPHELRFPLER